MVRFLVFLFAVMTSCFAQAQVASGTGFFFSPNGHVATNYHVIEGASFVAVRDLKGVMREAEVLAVDRANDLAVLKVRESGLTYLALRPSTDVRKGESVYTVGFPNVQMQGLEAKVTGGIISSLSGLLGEPNAFQISVPLQPGNSGGPLFDKSGAVVGIVAAKLSAAASIKAGSGLPENVNYAVKSNYLIELVRTNRNIVGASIGKPKGSSVDFPDIVERIEKATVLVLSNAAVITAKKHKPAANSVPPGGACTDSNECKGSGIGSYFCAQNSGKCTQPYTVSEGGYCADSRECKGGLVCSSGQCRSDK